jgi:hypothetical protein
MKASVIQKEPILPERNNAEFVGEVNFQISRFKNKP